MRDLFWLSYAMLWIMVIILFGCVALLLRYHGLQYSVGRAGRVQHGPQQGRQLSSLSIVTVDGESLTLVGDAVQVVFFGSTSCGLCRPALQEIMNVCRITVGLQNMLVVYRANADDVIELGSHDGGRVGVVADPDWLIARKWQIAVVPFVVALDRSGRVLYSALAVAHAMGELQTVLTAAGDELKAVSS